MQAAVAEMDDPAFPDRLERLLDDAETEVASMFTIYRQGLVERQRALWAELSTATELRSFGPALVPGQLQTEEYARLLFALDAEHAGLQPADIDAAIAGRLDYGRSMRERPDVIFHAVVTEYALRLPLPGASPKLRSGLLRNLVDAATCPNITIQILPMSAPVPSMILGGFGIATSTGGKATVYVETYSAQLTFTAARDLEEYEHRWRLFTGSALTPQETIRWAQQHLK
ncbi:hypothetical protein Rhe02_81330 [Rhizocola hellebori]|uniref:DUF5753 domain-containing protein n=1 Tax=Rhizocola hellebori TaxID=1392758 RepID=A0A8J3QGD9_9ACTN|nr:hypothetical protein Rhe02_81330 [Rhizocola hellebori]